MSFSVSSCFTCSRRASSASVTSASSPTEGALLSCRCASLLSTPFHRKPNRNPRPHQPLSPCGAAPTAVVPWPSSNDSPQRNSNYVLHHSWPQLHELTRSHTALITLQSVPPKCVFLPSIYLLSIPA